MIIYHVAKGLLPHARHRAAFAAMVSVVLGAVAVAGPMVASEVPGDGLPRVSDADSRDDDRANRNRF